MLRDGDRDIERPLPCAFPRVTPRGGVTDCEEYLPPVFRGGGDADMDLEGLRRRALAGRYESLAGRERGGGDLDAERESDRRAALRATGADFGGGDRDRDTEEPETDLV